MELNNKTIVVTGGGNGIGEAMVRRFHREGAKALAVVDLDGHAAGRVAAEVGGLGVELDVSDGKGVAGLVERVEREIGPIDLFCSNAGVSRVSNLSTPIDDWQQLWDVNVMSQIHAARAVVPRMIERGGGYLLNTASAAGLLSQIGSLAYSVTKHASVALSEWLAITHHHQGIRVSVLCPQAVATNIVANSPTEARRSGPGVASGDGVLTKEDVAECVSRALDEERFWVLPHSEVAEYARRKGTDIDRWLGGMRRFQDALYEGRSLPGDWLVKGRDA